MAGLLNSSQKSRKPKTRNGQDLSKLRNSAQILCAEYPHESAEKIAQRMRRDGFSVSARTIQRVRIDLHRTDRRGRLLDASAGIVKGNARNASASLYEAIRQTFPTIDHQQLTARQVGSLIAVGVIRLGLFGNAGTIWLHVAMDVRSKWTFALVAPNRSGLTAKRLIESIVLTFMRPLGKNVEHIMSPRNREYSDPASKGFAKFLVAQGIRQVTWETRPDAKYYLDEFAGMARAELLHLRRNSPTGIKDFQSLYRNLQPLLDGQRDYFSCRRQRWPDLICCRYPKTKETAG